MVEKKVKAMRCSRTCDREERRDLPIAWRTSTFATGLLRHSVPRNDKPASTSLSTLRPERSEGAE
jgi:hypothetical protein